MSQHHPSCKPSDKHLVWLCNQCGGHESAEYIDENDTKRLDWAIDHPSQFDDINSSVELVKYAPAIRRERIRKRINAAMLETGQQKVDWLRAAAGPTEEQQTCE